MVRLPVGEESAKVWELLTRFLGEVAVPEDVAHLIGALDAAPDARDGRAELHKWKDGRTVWTNGGVLYNPANPDVTWLQQRTSAHK